MISETYAPDIVKVAKEHGIEPAAMLAVVEVESSGSPLERDGRTPKFLFERHVFYRALKKRAGQAKLREAVSKGLAHQTWQKSQYKDQGSSAAKLALLERARAIDEECANRACSWGLGQVLGDNAESLGFANATAMVNRLTQGGVPAQLELMATFIERNNLIGALNRHNWADFARVYNGAGYARNRYDTKLANSYARWLGAVDRIVPREGPPPIVEPGALAIGARGDSVTDLQSKLSQLGYAVGEIDGDFGSNTRNAVSSFQMDHGLSPTGIADESTLDALAAAAGRPPIVSEPGLPISDEALRSLLLLLLQRIVSEGRVSGAPQTRTDPGQFLQTIVAELVKQRLAGGAGIAAGTTVPIASSTPPVLTWIDKLFPASEFLAGKKTALSVIAYVALTVLKVGVPGVLTGGTSTILTALIGGVGGLGLLSKFDRVVDLMGIIAKKPTVLDGLGRPEVKPADTRYGGHLGDVPFWER